MIKKGIVEIIKEVEKEGELKKEEEVVKYNTSFLKYKHSSLISSAQIQKQKVRGNVHSFQF